MAVDLSLAAARAQSDEAFRDQFNQDSKNHHGGDTRTVGVQKEYEQFGPGAFGGGKIPDGMMVAAQGEGEYVPPPKVEYGEEYDKIMAEREHLNKLKVSINKVNAACGVMLTDLTNKDFAAKRDAAVEDLKAFIPKLGEDNQWSKEIATICDEAMGDAEDLAKKIHEMANKTNRDVFAYNKKMLQRIKDIKKEYAAAQKAKAAEEKA